MTKKLGWNFLKWSVFGAGLTSVLLSLLLVYSPAAGAFSQSTATCKGGDSVTCNGFKCSATDNVGCWCKDETGTIVDQKPCKRNDVDLLLEGNES